MANFQMEWIILESGSSGNASLLRWGAHGILIDGGVPPSRLHTALRRHRVDPSIIRGLVLTHIHGDHCHVGLVRDTLLRHLPVFAHESHFKPLAGKAGLTPTMRKRLVALEPGKRNPILPGWLVETLPLPHGDMVNQGLVFEVDQGLFEPGLRLAYLTDLGDWDETTARFASNCDLLGLEFNHDETMQKESGRPWFLIQRNLGGDGHLSNKQAGQCLERISQLSTSRPLRGLVQLHLSRSCNVPALARKAARTATATTKAGKTAKKPRVWTCVPGAEPLRIEWKPGVGRLRQLGPPREPALEPKKKPRAAVTPGPTLFDSV